METYEELKQRHQREVNELPFFFAFSNEQFSAGMAKFNLSPDDTDKIYRFPGTGGYYLRTDAKLIHDTLNRHEAERKAAIEADTKGDCYIFQMFLYELRNHEFPYTWRLDDTLDALGLTIEEVDNSIPLTNGLRKAIAEIRKQKY